MSKVWGFQLKWRGQIWWCTLLCACMVTILISICWLFDRSKTLLPPSGQICVRFMGGLGNLMFQYASSYGIAEAKHMAFGMAKSDKLWSVFPGLKAVRTEHVCSGYRIHTEKRACAFDQETMDFLASDRVQLYGYLQSWKYFSHVENDIRLQFTFNHQTLEKARKLLTQSKRLVRKNDDAHDEVIAIGVHVRRTDKLSAESISVGYVVPGKAYLDKAMNYFRRKFRRPLIFIVCSDDEEWTKDNIKDRDTVIVSRNSAEVDMALLSLCDHNIITIGTFGWWSAFLSNGTTVYYGNSFRSGSWLEKNAASDPRQTHFFPPHWISMT
ncbi:galactoside 2-alpha-L-fucosyltransferase SEC1-like [Liolophura sinensis]|uniref:galactoside 2-alpha-L-fucosyltransferase SEC1-like n=1 Tax=Liolophura sinensis TaxID=3198878 RepID=UPI0031591355